MFSSVGESLIKKYCGKFLKNFSSDNISISVTGVIKLSNIEVLPEELNQYQLPYKLVRGFAGEIILDLPFIPGGNFNINVKNCIVVLEKDDVTTTSMDPSTANAILQSLIALFYLSYNNPETKQSKTMSGADLEKSQRMLDRFVVTLENIHVRFEERFESHVPMPEDNSLMCTGIVLDRLEIRTAKPQEIAAAPEVFMSLNPRASLVINKVLRCTRLSVYCKREDTFCGTQKRNLTLNQVCNFHYHREGGNLLEPVNCEFIFSGAFQKTTQVFGPVRLDIRSESMDLQVTDDQLCYLANVARTLVDQLHKVQTNAWVAFAKSAPVTVSSRSGHNGSSGSGTGSVVDRRRVARLRWDMVRKSIRVDWLKYTAALQGGAMRWRSWFQTWRLAARYVALREVLMYHVGYESVVDASTGLVSYAVRENLIMNYDGNKYCGSGAHQSLKSDIKSRYVGKGNFSEQVLRSAQHLIRRQMISGNAYFSREHTTKQLEHSLVSPSDSADGSPHLLTEEINPFDLSENTIRALYALQIDLDAELPFRVSAFCRIYAEEKYKTKQLRKKASAAVSGRSDAPQSPVKSKTTVRGCLLVSVLDAVNLAPSFGASSVNAYVSLKADIWLEGGSETVSGDVASEVNAATGTAFVQWGNVASLDLSPSQVRQLTAIGDAAVTEAAAGSVTNQSIAVECFERGFFSISHGTALIVTQSLLQDQSPASSSAKSLDSRAEFVGEPTTLTVKLQRATGIFGSAVTSGGKEAEVRLLSMVVVGDEEVLSAARNKFTEKVADVLKERRTVLERAAQLATNESFAAALPSSSQKRGSAQGEQEEEVDFILDPSQLTVQDVQVTFSIPRLTFQALAVYVVPERVRSADGNEDLPYSANIPLVRVAVEGLLVKAAASNNPWVVRGVGNVDSLRVQLLQTDPADRLKPELEPLLSLPRLSSTFSLTQTSSMGRFIDGLLDPSCFDFSGSVSMFPFTVTVTPQTLFSAVTSNATPQGGKVNIWRAVRSLDHLWLQPAQWARGMSSAHPSGIEGHGASHRLKPEAAVRLGDPYSANPRYLNVVREFCSSMSAEVVKKLSDRSGNSGLPKQSTKLHCLAPTRSLDVQVTVQPELHSLRNEDMDSVILANQLASTHLQTYEASRTNVVLDWFNTAAAGVANTAGVAQAPTAADATAWAAEKKRLLERIRDLEERNKMLLSNARR